MQIQPIIQQNSYNSYQNRFTTKPVNQVSFAGFSQIKNFKSACVDIFETDFSKLNLNFKNSIDNIYKKINEQSHIYTPEKLERAITEVKNVCPNNNEKEILTTMQRLTQWANYSSFNSISENLNNLEICNITRHVHTPLNDCFRYLIESKRVIFCSQYAPKTGILISKNELNQIHPANKNSIYINLEGFDDGINFFTDDNKLAQKTISVLKKTNNLKRQKSKLSFEEALSTILNGKINKTMQEKGYSIETITRRAPISRETILEQMSPCIPKSKDDIAQIISITAQKICPNNPLKSTKLRNIIASYFEKNIIIENKQSLIEHLKNMTIKINNYAKTNDIEPENITYLIPYTSVITGVKSYGIISEMYKRLNDIPEKQFVKSNQFDAITNYPEKTMTVILDDVCISGDSLISCNDYNNIAYTFNKDNHILFCPIICKQDGFDNINETIISNRRENSDKIFTEKIITDVSKFDFKARLTKLFFKNTHLGRLTLDDDGYGKNKNFKFIILPYMTPDNNTALSSLISHFFIPNSDKTGSLAIKNIHILHSAILNKFYETIKNITNINQ